MVLSLFIGQRELFVMVTCISKNICHPLMPSWTVMMPKFAQWPSISMIDVGYEIIQGHVDQTTACLFADFFQLDKIVGEIISTPVIVVCVHKIYPIIVGGKTLIKYAIFLIFKSAPVGPKTVYYARTVLRYQVPCNTHHLICAGRS